MFAVTYISGFKVIIADMNPCCDELSQCLKLFQ